MSHGSVLVVEDDPTLREALCDTLELAGYSVSSASDGEDALTKLSEESVGMVVSDVQMRPMNGHELLARIKSSHPQTPVLLMTAYGNIEKAVSAMRNGAVDYLAKPFEPEQDFSALVSVSSNFFRSSLRSFLSCFFRSFSSCM